jgi:glycosyltransferase involved in cell wall biosynthesis
VATFTYDLATTVGEREIVAIHPPDEPGPYPAEVRHRIRRDVQTDYVYAAQALNDCGVDVVSVQFEPEIWGGEDGAYVLDFVEALRVPYVVTLHSVSKAATAVQRRILSQLVAGAGASVVMSKSAAKVLARSCDVEPDSIEIVPYGVSDLPLAQPDTYKQRLGLQGKPIVLSFGLLTPDKGFESVIEAMAQVVRTVPSARYVILGATSPETVRADGEAYRAALEARVTELKLTENVKFVDRFVGRVELHTWLEAADVFVAASPNLVRTVSGTLASAMGAGKAIVSTGSAYATEQLANGTGRLVDAGSVESLANAITEILGDSELRGSMGRQAYERSRGMVWWEVGRQYREVFQRAVSGSVGGSVSRARGRLTGTQGSTKARSAIENGRQPISNGRPPVSNGRDPRAVIA